MLKKYAIYIYDDIAVVDDTDFKSEDKEQVNALAITMLNQSPDGITAEVYQGTKIVSIFKKTRKGNIKKMKNPHHPNWGGRRENQTGRPRKPENEVLGEVVKLRINNEISDYLNSLCTNKAEWIRQAIRERMAKEGTREEEKENGGQ